MRVAVVSHAFWQNRLNADASRGWQVHHPERQRLHGRRRRAAAVRRRGGRSGAGSLGAHGAAAGSAAADGRSARALGNADLLGARGPRWLSAVGRLKPGSDLAQTLAGLDVVARRLQAAYPDTNAPRTFNAVPLGEGPGVRASSRAAAPAARRVRRCSCCSSPAPTSRACCSPAACPAVARWPIRMAVGAGQSRLVRQWLTESVLLALFGRPRRRRARELGRAAPAPRGNSGNRAISVVNGRVLAFTFAVAAGSGILFGLAPVLQTLRGEHDFRASRRRGRCRHGQPRRTPAAGVRGVPGCGEPHAARGRRPFPADASQRARRRSRLRPRFDAGGRHQPGRARVLSRRRDEWRTSKYWNGCDRRPVSPRPARRA